MEVLWNKCLEKIVDQVVPENYNTWFTPTSPISCDDHVFTLGVPNEFFKKYLKSNTKKFQTVLCQDDSLAKANIFSKIILFRIIMKELVFIHTLKSLPFSHIRIHMRIREPRIFPSFML